MLATSPRLLSRGRTVIVLLNFAPSLKIVPTSSVHELEPKNWVFGSGWLTKQYKFLVTPGYLLSRKV